METFWNTQGKKIAVFNVARKIDMADLNTERAKASARKALDFLNAEKFRNANWRDKAPWEQRQDLAYALDMLTELSAITLNLADRVANASYWLGMWNRFEGENSEKEPACTNE